ncbi:MAG: N-6 DNA methylase, partial [Oricola sp.]
MLTRQRDSAGVQYSSGQIHRQLRQFASSIQITDPKATERRLEFCRELLEQGALAVEGHEQLDLVDVSDSIRHYAASALYMLLMPQSRRQKLSAYFTPPFVTEHIVNRVVSFGYDPLHDTALDPACGGAAFLVPLVRRIRETATACKWKEEDIRDYVSSAILGIEIEPGLASLSRLLIADALGDRTLSDSRSIRELVIRGNALREPASEKKFDLV